MSWLEVCGWIGNLCFITCSIPQVVMTWRQGHAEGLSLAFLGIWMAGLVFSVVYMLPTRMWPNLTNYAASIVLVGILLKFKLAPRVRKHPSPERA